MCKLLSKLKNIERNLNFHHFLNTSKLTEVVGDVMQVPLMDIAGRRPLLIVPISVMIVDLVAMTICLALQVNSTVYLCSAVGRYDHLSCTARDKVYTTRPCHRL